MTTKKEMERKIVGALWQAELNGGFTENGIIVHTDDSDKFLITIILIEDD